MLVLAHRGAADVAHPENTVAAVERALRGGADGVEVDVRLTRDGTVVCLHDASLDRVAGIARDVTTMTRRQVAAVRLPTGHRVPSLADVVEAVRGRGRLVVEMKTCAATADRTAVAVATTLRRLRVTPRSDVVVSSFDQAALATLRARVAVGTAVLALPGTPAATTVRRALDDGHDEAHPHVSDLLAAPPGLVRDARTLGVGTVAWTVNRSGDVRRLAARGVAAVICDDPAAARAAVPRAPGPRDAIRCERGARAT